MSVYCTLFSSRPGLTRHGPARHGPTANRSRFCEANNFFISTPSELRLCISLQQALIRRFFNFQKLQKQKSSIFVSRFPKNFLSRNFQKLLKICILDTSYRRYFRATVHISMIIKRVCLHNFTILWFTQLFSRV